MLGVNLVQWETEPPWGENSAGINLDVTLLSHQHLLTNDHHLKRRRLQIPAGQISFMMDRNLLQLLHLIGLWLSAALSWLDSRCFWQWLIANASSPPDAAWQTVTVSVSFPLRHQFIWIRRISVRLQCPTRSYISSLECKWSLQGHSGILTPPFPQVLLLKGSELSCGGTTILCWEELRAL